MNFWTLKTQNKIIKFSNQFRLHSNSRLTTRLLKRRARTTSKRALALSFALVTRWKTPARSFLIWKILKSKTCSTRLKMDKEKILIRTHNKTNSQVLRRWLFSPSPREWRATTPYFTNMNQMLIRISIKMRTRLFSQRWSSCRQNREVYKVRQFLRLGLIRREGGQL